MMFSPFYDAIVIKWQEEETSSSSSVHSSEHLMMDKI